MTPERPASPLPGRGSRLPEPERLAESLELLERAKKFLSQGRWQESEVAYRKLIDLGIHRAEGFYGVGLIRFLSKDLNAAADELKRCLQLDPQNSNAYYYLGEISVARNAPDAARSFYAKAIQIRPGHVGAVKRLKELSDRESGLTHGASSRTSTPSVELGGSGSYGFYDLIRRDESPLAQETLRLIDSLRMTVRPLLSAYLGQILAVMWIMPLTVVLFMLTEPPIDRAVSSISHEVLTPMSNIGVAGRTMVGAAMAIGILSFVHLLIQVKAPSILPMSALLLLLGLGVAITISIGGNTRGGIIVPTLAGVIASILAVIVLIIRTKTTIISVEEGRLQVAKGIFLRKAENFELYRVLDMELQQNVFNRFTADGTLVLSVVDVQGVRMPTRIRLTGLAKMDRLQEIFRQLRSLTLLLRTGPWGKGVIY